MFTPVMAADDTTVMFVVGYVVGLALSIYTITMVPKIEGLPPKIAQNRTAAIVLGFLPCCWVGPVVQIISLISYNVRSKRIITQRAGLQGSLGSSFDTPSSGRPGPTPPPAGGAGPNPFD